MSDSIAKSLHELNSEIKLIVTEINALVDSKFELRMLQKKVNHCKTYKYECHKAITTALTKYISAHIAYTTLKRNAEASSPHQFRNLYFTLRSQYLQLSKETNKPPLPIEEWEIPYSGGVPQFFKPQYKEPAASWTATSLFAAKNHYKGRIHVTKRGAMSQLAQLIQIKQNLIEQEISHEKMRTINNDIVHNDFEEIQERMNILSVAEQDWRDKYKEYSTIVKIKMNEFIKLNEEGAYASEDVGSVWKTFFSRSRRHTKSHLCKTQSETIQVAESLTETNFPNFDTELSNITEKMKSPIIIVDEKLGQYTSPKEHINDNEETHHHKYSSTKTVEHSPFENPISSMTCPPFKRRRCMHCKSEMVYTRSSNGCTWTCSSCVNQNRNFQINPGYFRNNGLIRNPLLLLSQTTRERIGVEFPEQVWKFISVHDQESGEKAISHMSIGSRNSNALIPLDQNRIVSDGIFVGPKGGNSKVNEQKRPVHPLEQMFDIYDSY